ncbi:MAG: chemotaxis protein CheW [Campylobacterota bacterium]|nr:chemotaxis protein CheW [Campylobacterota bacterium]
MELEDILFDLDDEELINSDGEQYFLFLSGGDIYALPASNVIEIVEYQHITKVPKLFSFIKGITNIRGEVIGVVDLLNRCGLGDTEITNRTSLVIVNTTQNDKKQTVALMIDEIYEVDGLDNDSISSAPSFGTKVKSSFIKNIARYNKMEITVLDCDTLLSIDELSRIKD